CAVASDALQCVPYSADKKETDAHQEHPFRHEPAHLGGLRRDGKHHYFAPHGECRRGSKHRADVRRDSPGDLWTVCRQFVRLGQRAILDDLADQRHGGAGAPVSSEEDVYRCPTGERLKYYYAHFEKRPSAKSPSISPDAPSELR